MTSPARTIEQRRAAHALRAASTIDRELGAHYRSYVERLGPSILMNGLGQAVATERAAGGDQRDPEERAHFAVYANLTSWLCGSDGVYRSGDLLKAIVENDEAVYLRAQAEALAWLVWHKKFCRAYLPRALQPGSGS